MVDTSLERTSRSENKRSLFANKLNIDNVFNRKSNQRKRSFILQNLVSVQKSFGQEEEDEFFEELFKWKVDQISANVQ